MSRTFAADETLLRDALRRVIREAEGEPAWALHEEAVALAENARRGDAEAADTLAGRVSGMSLENLQG